MTTLTTALSDLRLGKWCGSGHLPRGDSPPTKGQKMCNIPERAHTDLSNPVEVRARKTEHFWLEIGSQIALTQ